jgi:hypothetical protein
MQKADSQTTFTTVFVSLLNSSEINSEVGKKCESVLCNVCNTRHGASEVCHNS